MKGLDVVATGGDDLTGQIALVVEVVGYLRSADPRGAPHLFDAGVGDAALEHETGGDVNDARASSQPLPGEPRRGMFRHVAALRARGISWLSRWGAGRVNGAVVAGPVRRYRWRTCADS